MTTGGRPRVAGWTNKGAMILSPDVESLVDDYVRGYESGQWWAHDELLMAVEEFATSEEGEVVRLRLLHGENLSREIEKSRERLHARFAHYPTDESCSDEPIAYVIETTPPLPGIPRVIWAVAGSIERAREKAAATGLPLTRHSIRPATPRTIDQEGH